MSKPEYDKERAPGIDERDFDDGSGEVCVECGGPHFDCTDPAWEDE